MKSLTLIQMKPSKNGEIIGNAGSTLSANRNVSSAYMEVFVPMTSNIELSLAGRQDIYSDFGQAFSPKAALRWQLGPQLLLRSSVGRGFKAPNMDVLYQARAPKVTKILLTPSCAQKRVDQPVTPNSGGWMGVETPT